MQKPETTFRQNTVLPFLKKLKHTCAEPIQQKAIGGSPDYLLCSNGVYIALEIKSEDGELTALQEFKMQEVERCGGVGLVAYPSNWETIKKILIHADENTRHREVEDERDGQDH